MRIKQQQGLTLVEVLAVLVIFSIISVLLMNILGFSTSTYQKQLTKNKELQNTSIVLKLITKDFRKSVKFDEATYTFTTIVDGVKIEQTYVLSDNEITRNGEIIATDMEVFELSNQESSSTLTIRLKSKHDQEIRTELTSRKKP
ncbi:hypothetical protein C3943_06940 [Lysinibacillus sp. B2A1]|nr:hypothetical protein C3943_06940 [Lysinibacillus sp. B2A1]